MLLLTAHNDAMTNIGDIHDESLDLYVGRLAAAGITPPERQRRLIPAGYTKPASWFKVRAILDALPAHDHVLWLDADSVVVGSADPYSLVTSTATLHVSSDLNGINCGVMAWRNCPEARDALWRVYDSYERFCGHPWWEQAALREFVHELSVAIIPKHILNAGPDDMASDSLIFHVAGKGPDEKLSLLQAKLAEIKK